MKPRFDRLNDLIVSLRAFKTPFDMNWYRHQRYYDAATGEPLVENKYCGSPACVLGHYATKFPRRAEWTHGLPVPNLQDYEEGDISFFEGWSKHFGISTAQVMELFEAEGCGGAKTRRQAIAYIKKFIKQNGGKVTA